MFRIKICGITTPEDAQSAVAAGADAIGLNFYSKSPRFVSVEQAQKIAEVFPNAIGVFVNSPAEEINTIAKSVGLSAVQLHGDEPAALLAEIDPQFPIIRACCLGEDGLASISKDLRQCTAAGRQPAAVLVDAAVAGHYGGTGQTANWSQLVHHETSLNGIPLILAGGLHPENIELAIHAVHPHGVDVASGVESEPGVKDPDKMRSFVQRAKQAFAEHSARG